LLLSLDDLDGQVSSKKRCCMPETGRSIECGECGFPIDEPVDLEASKRLPCPKCGSLKRKVRLSYSDTVFIHEKRKIKARSPDRGRPRYEAVEGDDLSLKSGIWMKIYRIIDRANNWYHERILNPRTNKVVHECDEPLDEHTGHGSDRRKHDKPS
jgi:hypothetical protein